MVGTQRAARGHRPVLPAGDVRRRVCEGVAEGARNATLISLCDHMLGEPDGMPSTAGRRRGGAGAGQQLALSAAWTRQVLGRLIAAELSATTAVLA